MKLKPIKKAKLITLAVYIIFIILFAINWKDCYKGFIYGWNSVK